jgi:uncharacterized protein
LLNDGSSVPFIARYRKEKTGSLDEIQIRSVDDKYKSEIHLLREKTRIKDIIKAQGQLTAPLESSIDNASSITELNDIYAPFKKKRKTKGVIARERGLEPLAAAIIEEGKLPFEINFFPKCYSLLKSRYFMKWMKKMEKSQKNYF